MYSEKKHKAFGNRQEKNPRKNIFTPSSDGSESPASCFITSVELWCPNHLFSLCREKGIPSWSCFNGYPPMIRYQGWFWYISWLRDTLLFPLRLMWATSGKDSKGYASPVRYWYIFFSTFFPLDLSWVLHPFSISYWPEAAWTCLSTCRRNDREPTLAQGKHANATLARSNTLHTGSEKKSAVASFSHPPQSVCSLLIHRGLLAQSRKAAGSVSSGDHWGRLQRLHWAPVTEGHVVLASHKSLHPGT